MYELILTIKQEDIDCGERYSLVNCPVATAVGRYFEAAEWGVEVDEDVYVQLSTDAFSDFIVDLYFKLDEAGQDFIGKFDEGQSVNPCQIVLTLTD